MTFVCPCVLLPLSCPCRVVYLRRQESGREDRHTSLALHSIKLKNFGPFRDEVLFGGCVLVQTYFLQLYMNVFRRRPLLRRLSSARCYYSVEARLVGCFDVPSK